MVEVMVKVTVRVMIKITVKVKLRLWLEIIGLCVSFIPLSFHFRINIICVKLCLNHIVNHSGTA